MNYLNNIISETGISKVKIAKFLGVSRQMLYNYLALDKLSDLPKDKQNKLFYLLDIKSEDEIKNIEITEEYIKSLNKKINEELFGTSSNTYLEDFHNLNKKEQELLTELFVSIKDKLVANKNNDAYDTLVYLHNYIQTIDQVPEMKYILAYMSKSNGYTDALEFKYDENKQYTFEGILYAAMALYTSKRATKSKVAEEHKRFEQQTKQKKEDQLSRTQELNTFRKLALQELGYSTINDKNAKEVFEKIAEIMSRKF